MEIKTRKELELIEKNLGVIVKRLATEKEEYKKSGHHTTYRNGAFAGSDQVLGWIEKILNGEFMHYPED